MEHFLLAALPAALLFVSLRLWAPPGRETQRVLEFATLAVVTPSLLLGIARGILAARRMRRFTVSAQRLARLDFSAGVPVNGRGEPAWMARIVNELARVFGRNHAVHQALAHMDDAFLGGLRLRALVRSALRGVRLVTQAEVAVLGLLDADAPDTVHLFLNRKGGGTAVQARKMQMDEGLRRRIPLVLHARSTAHSPLPPQLEQSLRGQYGVAHFLVLPIAHGGRLWGLMVACHRVPVEFAGELVRLLESITARMAAALSGAERDRKLHSMANVDALTGLPNRVALPALVARELAVAQHDQSQAAIVLLDLDRFKQVNDAHGHAIGDRLLVQVSNRIRSSVREEDVVARTGGDEFAVLLGNIHSTRDAASVTRKLIQSLSRRFEIEGRTIYSGASAGVSVYPDDSRNATELLKMAETALFRAKSGGRSRFAFFEEPMHAESQQRATLDGELRQALLREEFVLHYQPQMDLHTGALSGVEALVRWQHPIRGLLYPKDFIEFAEEIGLIPEIGAWVMIEACRQYQRWRRSGIPVPRVSVNVSNGQLPRSNFIPNVRQILATSGMPPGALEVEVTETMLFEGGRAAGEAIEQLAADGLPIAIDDFGTGYSSFSQLRTIPAGVLKMDMSFLAGATMGNDAGKIVAAIVNMAHALQKEVVAEGVENVEQLKLLKHLGCERGQGYLFGKPVPPEHIGDMFRSDARHAPERAVPAAASGTLRSALSEPARAAPPPPPADDRDFDNRGEPATVPLPLSEYEERVQAERSRRPGSPR